MRTVISWMSGPAAFSKKVLRRYLANWGIHLTQVATIGSVAVYGRVGGGLSADTGGTRSSIQQRAGLPGLSVPPALARRVSLFALPRDQSVAAANGTLAMCQLRASDLGDGGDDFSRYANPAYGLVSCHVVGDQSEKWSQRLGATASLGLGELPDGLGLAAQTAAGHGKARTGSTLGTGRGR